VLYTIQIVSKQLHSDNMKNTVLFSMLIQFIVKMIIYSIKQKINK